MKDRQYPWLMLAGIYITQYIGIAFILSATVVILRQQGVDLDKLALINLALLPLAGKVLYAPIIDKYRLPLQGKYRSWLIIAQTNMALLLMVAGIIDFEQHFTWILIVMALYVFCMSIQDVSVDGLSCKLFDSESRKFANSIQFSGNLLGNIIGGGLILMLYPWLHWHGALWLLASLSIVSLIQIILFIEPEYAASHHSQLYKHGSLFFDIIDFIKQQKRWFIAMVLYPVGSTCGFALLSPLLVDNDWPLDDIGFATKIFGSLIGLISAFLATPLITRIGRINALISVIFIQGLALVLMLPLTFGNTGTFMVYTAITVHFISFPALLVISSTMMMDKAAPTSRKATFFTLQFSVASLLGFTYSAISMAIAKHIGYSAVVIVGSVLTFAIAFFIWFILGRKEGDQPHCNAAIQYNK